MLCHLFVRHHWYALQMSHLSVVPVKQLRVYLPFHNTRNSLFQDFQNVRILHFQDFLLCKDTTNTACMQKVKSFSLSK